MGKNLTRKILEAHLAKPSDMKPGEEIYVKVDQTLTHDINAWHLRPSALTGRRWRPASVTWTTTCCTWTIRPRMTTFIYSLVRKGLVFMCPDREMVSATQFMWQDLACLAN